MSESEREAKRPADASSGRSDARPLPLWARWLSKSAAWLLALIGTVALGVVMLVAIALAVAYPNLPEVSGLMDYRPKLPMRIFSADGVLLGEYGEERRNFVPLAQIPKVMQEAVLASEDARFYQHSGVDIKGVFRAGLAQFSRSRSQGASTITMQVARNFYLSTEKTYTRKIYEMLLAFKMESLLTKDQILEVYMNQIFLGQRAYGFASAAEIYFGKPLKDISSPKPRCSPGFRKRRRPTTRSTIRSGRPTGSCASSIAWSTTASSRPSSVKQPRPKPCATGHPPTWRCTPSTWPKPHAS